MSSSQDEVTLLAPDGVAAAGRTLALPAGSLRLVLPAAGRKLERATLTLKAVDATGSTLSAASVSTDAGALPLAVGVTARWVAARWPADRAVTGVRIDATGTDGKGARLKVLSGGTWLPLSPVDVVALNAAQSFPAVAAAQVMAELLVDNKLDGKSTGVAVPGTLAVTGLSVTATGQPCHVAVAIGDDPPFFIHTGPLPLDAVTVDGLARAANRYLADHPDAAEVPLSLRAASAASLIVESFAAGLQPLPPPPSQPGNGAANDADARGVPRPGEQVWIDAAEVPAMAGQWCDASHASAQAFAPPPAGSALSSFRLGLRVLAAPCTGTLTIHADAHGRPGDVPLANAAATFSVETVPAADAPAWVVCRLPQPWPATGAPWWAVCRVTAGEGVWFATPDAPDAAGKTLYQIDGGPWLPAPAAADAHAWLRTAVRLAPAAAAGSG